MPWVLLAVGVFDALLVGCTLAWLQLQARLDRLELLAMRAAGAAQTSDPALPGLVMAPPLN